jgi:hypothetical protein
MAPAGADLPTHVHVTRRRSVRSHEPTKHSPQNARSVTAKRGTHAPRRQVGRCGLGRGWRGPLAHDDDLLHAHRRQQLLEPVGAHGGLALCAARGHEGTPHSGVGSQAHRHTARAGTAYSVFGEPMRASERVRRACGGAHDRMALQSAMASSSL